MPKQISNTLSPFMAVDVRGSLAPARPASPLEAAPWRLEDVFPEDSRINERGNLEIGGCDVMDLVRDYGTPSYIFAEEDLRRRAREYQEAFRRVTDNFEVLFASKALPSTALYKIFAEEGLSVDVASGGELFMACRAGVPPERIYFHGNNKSDREIAEALGYGVGYVVIDSFDEIERLKALVEDRQKVLVRVTPGVKAHTFEAAQTGQNDSKFGFSLKGGEAVKAIEAIRAAPNLDLVGLHAHIGSQITNLQEFEEEIDAVAVLADPSFSILNIGGGLGISYLPSDTPPSITSYVETILARIASRFDPMPRVLVEPGRSLVGRAGVTAYEVGTVKTVPGARTYVAVDGGMSDNLRPMLYTSEYSVAIADRPDADPNMTVDVVGKHCETGDNLVHQTELLSPSVGDILVTAATGAYGHSMANNYNGVPRPPVLFCKDGDIREVVRREVYKDLVARDN
jgi:diaminopimelate decarboxylase